MASSSLPLTNREPQTEINEAAKAASASADAACAAPPGSQHKAHNQPPSAAVTGAAAAAAAAATRAPLPAAPAAAQEAQHPDDAPMTPVVYLVRQNAAAAVPSSHPAHVMQDSAVTPTAWANSADSAAIGIHLVLLSRALT